MKQVNTIVFLGTAICLLGEVVRKGAMITAWNNFTHLVRDKKVEGHVLITHGLYSIFRHPGYAGWFWWSVGTQIIMVNPICFVGYFIASSKYAFNLNITFILIVYFSYLSLSIFHRFFQSRIYYEEACLISFFTDYTEYQKSVPRTGVPFAKGFLDFTGAVGAQ